MDADEQLIAEARIEAEEVAGDILTADSVYREVFMNRLIELVSKQVCKHCWAGPIDCQCWNDE